MSNPANCAADWRFYFSNAFHTDTEFGVSEGACSEAPAPELYEWPSHICIGLKNSSADPDSDYVTNNTFVGGYVINETSSALSDGFPHWMKPPNCNWDDDVYLYWDGFFGYWQIGSELHVESGTFMLCFQEEDYSPIACSRWYDGYLDSMDNMYLYECSASDVIPSCASTFTVPSTGRTVGIVMTVLFFVFCGVILLWFYRKNMREKAEVTFDGGHGASGSDGLEDSDFHTGHRKTDSNAALTSNAAVRKVDFSPLNVEETNTAKSGDTVNGTKGDEDDVIPPESDDVEDDEKKDEIEVGIDTRRLSQQMIETMKRDIQEWTDALIKDPKEAVRRYSRDTETGSVPKEAILAMNAVNGPVPAVFPMTVPVEQLDMGDIDENEAKEKIDLDDADDQEEMPEPLDLFDDDGTAKSTDQLVTHDFDSNEEQI